MILKVTMMLEMSVDIEDEDIEIGVKGEIEVDLRLKG